MGICGSFRGVSAGIREVSGMQPGQKASCVKRCISQGIRTFRRMRCQDLLQIEAFLYFGSFSSSFRGYPRIVSGCVGRYPGRIRDAARAER